MQTLPQKAGRTKTLVFCVDGVGWAEMEPWLEQGAAPFLSGLAQKGVSGPLQVQGDSPAKWRLSPEQEPGETWQALSRAGVRVGVFNLPGLWPPRPVEGFMVCTKPRAGSPGAQIGAFPNELLPDLADCPFSTGLDYPSGPAAPSPSWLDYAFASQSALTRIHFEHACRLFHEYRVDVAAFGCPGMGEVRSLFPQNPKKIARFLGQVDRYLAEMTKLTGADTVAVLGMGRENSGGVIWGGHLRPGLPAPLEALTDFMGWLAGMHSVDPARHYAGGAAGARAPA